MRIAIHPLEHLLRRLHVPSRLIWWHLRGVNPSRLWSIFLFLWYWVVSKGGVIGRSHMVLLLLLLGMARLWLLLYVGLRRQKLATRLG